MRLATWNVERPKPTGWKIPPAQRRRMAEVDADIWVLTETHLQHAPTDAHTYAAFSPPHPGRRPAHERWVAIWSRFPLEELSVPAANRRGTLATRITTPAGDILVYGTVIPWANEPTDDAGRPARMWEVHLAEITRQSDDWAVLRERYPDTPLVVAGDFNQDRDGSGWYGTARTREALTRALDRSGLHCLTSSDAIAAGWLESSHLVDHICVSSHLTDRATVRCWEKVDGDGQRLSDHPVVAIDILIPDHASS